MTMTADSAARTDVTREQCLWVYGVVSRSFQVPASIGGPDAAPLQMCAVGPVAAVYSTIDPAAFEGLVPEVREGSPLAVIARRHDRTVRGLAKLGTVLPARLGTVFPDLRTVVQLLSRTATELAAALTAVYQRVEWNLRVRTPASGPRRNSAALDQSGTDYLLRRRDERRLAEESHEALAAAMIAADEALVLRAERVTGRGLAPGRDSMSRAYLVPDWVATEFEMVAAEVRAELERQGCVVTLAGPLPPYSFVNVRLEFGHDCD